MSSEALCGASGQTREALEKREASVRRVSRLTSSSLWWFSEQHWKGLADSLQQSGLDLSGDSQVGTRRGRRCLLPRAPETGRSEHWHFHGP